MPVNHYFQGGNGIGNQNEKRLYEDLIVEGLKIYGHDVYYLPRTLVNRDLMRQMNVAVNPNRTFVLSKRLRPIEKDGKQDKVGFEKK